MTKKEAEQLMLEKAYKEGYNKARFEFSKNEGFITKEYFKGYDAAIEHVKSFLTNVAPEAVALTIRVRGYDGMEDVSLTEAMDRYITDVQGNYNRLRKQLGGKDE